MAGINRFDGKDKRRARLRNHIARDLSSSKYHQRVVPDGRRRRQITEDDDVFYEDVRYDEDHEQ